MNFKKDEFINPIVGSTSFTLSNFPDLKYPPLITRGGSQLISTDYNLSGNLLTLLQPIDKSIGGDGSEDIVVIYSY